VKGKKITPLRMERQSKLRAIAKRQLPARLAKYRRCQQQLAIAAKRPRLARSLQRQRRLMLIDLRHRRDAELRSYFESLKPEIEVQDGQIEGQQSEGRQRERAKADA
jgi:hypothetical protein